jgi:hypothetical protein
MCDAEILTHTKFAENLDSDFRVHLDSANIVDLRLVEVTELRETPRQEQFSLLFRGPLALFLPQQLYRMDHESFGSFEIFLVPVGRDAENFLYEAVFNRMRSGD